MLNRDKILKKTQRTVGQLQGDRCKFVWSLQRKVVGGVGGDHNKIFEDTLAKNGPALVKTINP